MSAVFSACGKFRYLLTRGTGPMFAGWVMLNGSTADGEKNDPTIAKVAGFSRDLGYDSFMVANVYGLVATKPADMLVHPDPVGAENDFWLSVMLASVSLVIVAWGTHAREGRVVDVLEMVRNQGHRPYCLGVNMDGSPKHPLYVPYSKRLQSYVMS